MYSYMYLYSYVLSVWNSLSHSAKYSSRFLVLIACSSGRAGLLISGAAAASGATKPFTPVRYAALAVAPGPACGTPDAV